MNPSRHHPVHGSTTFALAILFGIASAFVTEKARCAEKRNVPNVVMILADDVGWSDLGCYGADLHDTPNLDRFAREGVRFTQAYAASVCSPTRASIMTGKHPARLHITIWHESALHPVQNRKLIPPLAVANLPHEEETLAEALKPAGYFSAHVGKWHLGTAAFYPETQGFDVNIGGTFWGAPNTFFYPFRGAGRFGKEFRYVPGLGKGKAGEYLTDRLTDEALKIIDESGTNPFYLNLCFHNAHTPIEGKPDLVKRYESRIKPGLRHKNAGYAAMIHTLNFQGVPGRRNQRQGSRSPPSWLLIPHAVKNAADAK